MGLEIRGVVAAVALLPASATGGIPLLLQAPAKASGGLLPLVVNAGLVLLTGTLTLWLNTRVKRGLQTGF